LIVYFDSSVLVRAYLPDEEGHVEVLQMINDPVLGIVTGTWTRIEVSGALVRAARAGRPTLVVDEPGLLAALDSDLGPDGPITLLAVPQDRIEDEALKIVRKHGLRAMDSWHLAAALLTLPGLLEPDEESGFASRDQEQLDIAVRLGFKPM
jgi:predicted nucleic acid-binding protein